MDSVKIVGLDTSARFNRAEVLFVMQFFGYSLDDKSSKHSEKR